MSEINKSQLKSYATNARIDFIKAVKEKAAKFGIFPDHIVPAKQSGTLLIIDHLTYSQDVIPAYNKVLDMIDNLGYEETINEIAYTWFNRMIALRYMEIHNLLPHGYKVIGDKRPEILIHADHVVMNSLDNKKVTDLLLAGDKDEELYAYLLNTQLSELNKTLPFLFEKIDDAATLLMPDNLLATDSIRSKMVDLDEANFNQIEVIGWLYQFYISEVKDALMDAGKAYKKEEIPAVTQLFTPNWIVKYMVQNSLGAKWMETYPNSPLRSKMEYYIEPAEQTPEVQEQLNKIKDERINPEELKILDPACGSGHILVEAYDLLKEIYTEKGYSRREIPELILKNNLYGIDLDRRAAQLAYFALAMKACKDNPRLLEKEMKLNIICMEESNNINNSNIAQDLVDGTKIAINHTIVEDLLDNFADAKTYGSLIKIKADIVSNLDKLEAVVEEGLLSHNIFKQKAANDVNPFIKMAQFLATKYDCVIANPPYMGSKGQNALLKKFANSKYNDTKSDLFAMFIEQGFHLIKNNGYNAMVTMQSWMFLSSFEKMRLNLLANKTLLSMIHLGARAFREISGEVVQTTSFVFKNTLLPTYCGSYLRLIDGDDIEKENKLKNKENLYKQVSQQDFSKIPGSPIAYWASDKIKELFDCQTRLSEFCDAKQGLISGNNDLFLRYWYETKSSNTSLFEFNSNKKWFPHNKGGTYRKWYGNNEYVINWENNGFQIKNYIDNNGHLLSRPQNISFLFREGITWSSLSSGNISFRNYGVGFSFDAKGQALFPHSLAMKRYLNGILNSNVVSELVSFISPTLDYNCGVVAKLPIVVIKDDKNYNVICKIIDDIIDISKKDWDSFETSWDFKQLPILQKDIRQSSLKESYLEWRKQNQKDIGETLELEQENNRLFIDAYGLQDEITPEVPIEQITLTVNPRYRYKNNDATDEELEQRFKSDSIKELISYIIGCYMGRYSLDQDGLVYANEKDIDFDVSNYQTILADDDGIIPVNDFAWFPEQDIVNRISDFVEKVWGKETLEENMLFIAEALDKKPTETALEAIRRYMIKDFYKNHLQMYKNRPIYWLFSSGKEKAFECLVYMHRMNERTLARIRMQFIVPLISKYEASLNNIETAIDSATSIAERKTLEKQKDNLEKQIHELRDYDDLINHSINDRIDFDLDDGVKVNYAKFGKLLAESKKIVGK